MEKEVKRIFCDMCPEFKMDNEAQHKCFICGKDLCHTHAIIYYRQVVGTELPDEDRGKTIAFCWDHDPKKKGEENAENQD